MGDQFPTPCGNGVEGGAARTDIESGRDSSTEEEGAAFELVVKGADKSAKFGDRVAEFNFLGEPCCMARQYAVRATGDFLQELNGGLTKFREVGEKRLPHRGR